MCDFCSPALLEQLCAAVVGGVVTSIEKECGVSSFHSIGWR